MTEIRFELPVGGSYELTVFDVAGRRVTSFRGVGSTGPNAVNWDGRDEAGANLGSGVYYYTLQVGGKTATGKMVMVK
jgi:flagellar hook assembly protein FlgD